MILRRGIGDPKHKMYYLYIYMVSSPPKDLHFVGPQGDNIHIHMYIYIYMFVFLDTYLRVYLKYSDTPT